MPYAEKPEDVTCPCCLAKMARQKKTIRLAKKLKPADRRFLIDLHDALIAAEDQLGSIYGHGTLLRN